MYNYAEDSIWEDGGGKSRFVKSIRGGADVQNSSHLKPFSIKGGGSKPMGVRMSEISC